MTDNEINKIIAKKIMSVEWCEKLPCFAEDRPNYMEENFSYFRMVKRLVSSGYWFDFHRILQAKYPAGMVTVPISAWMIDLLMNNQRLFCFELALFLSDSGKS